MGLSTTHQAWSGGYRAFNQWRDFVAQALGYTEHLERAPDPQERWGEWPREPRDPLTVLMMHYDSAGIISPRDALNLDRRLDDFMNLQGRLEVTIPPDWNLQGLLKATVQFQKGLRRAGEAGETLEFH